MTKIEKSMKNDFEKYALSRGISSTKLDGYKKHSLKNYRGVNPIILEEREMNVIGLDVFSRLLFDRILFLGTPIDDDCANIINSQLMYLNSISEDPVKLFINSPGGSVLDGLSIYDVMNWVSCDVETYVMGMAASMGSVLLSSGTKGKRYALPNSRIMIHQPMSGAAPGTRESDFAIEYEELKKCKATLYRILSENTGKTLEEIERDADRDHWFSAGEGIDYGLVDSIVLRNNK